MVLTATFCVSAALTTWSMSDTTDEEDSTENGSTDDSGSTDGSETTVESPYDWHWTFNDWEATRYGSGTNYTQDGLTIYNPVSGVSSTVATCDVTYGDSVYTQCLKSGGASKFTGDLTTCQRVLGFTVTGPCEVYVIFCSTSSSSSATHYLTLRTATDTLGTTETTGADVICDTLVYSGTGEELYLLFSGNTYVYEIDVTYTDDTNAGDGNTNGRTGVTEEEEEEGGSDDDSGETLTATYTLAPDSVSGAWLSSDEAVANQQEANIDTVALIFKEGVYLNPSGSILATSDLQSATATAWQNVEGTDTVYIAVSGTDGTGWQYIIIGKGAIGDTTAYNNNFALGEMNAETMLYYYWEEPVTDPEAAISIVPVSPADSDTIEVLTELTYEVSGDETLYDFFIYTLEESGTGWADYITVSDTLGNTYNVNSISIDEDTGSSFTINIDTVSTESVVSVAFKEGFLGNTTWYSYNYSRGQVNKDTTFTYYVVPAVEEEVVIPELTYDLAIDTIIPSSDSYVDTLRSITLYFNQPVYINPNGSDDDTWSTVIALYNTTSREVAANATLTQANEGDNTIIVELDSVFSEYASYRLYLPQGVIGDSTAYKYDFLGGSLNARMSSAVIITVGGFTEGEVTADPADGSELSSLSAITLTWTEQSSLQAAFGGVPVITHVEGDSIVYTWEMGEDATYSESEAAVTLNLPTTIVEKGTYTLTVPAETFAFYLSGLYGYNSELTLTYTIDGTLGISNIDANAAAGRLDGKVYTVSGMLVKNTANLPAGVYIVNGKKTVVK